MLIRVLLLALLLCGEAHAVNYHAVCVGINNYYSAEYNLTKCVPSMLAIRNTLIDSLGWSSANIDTLTNGRATKDNILAAIRAMPRTENDISLFFFSGHGITNGIITYYGPSSTISPSEL